jgi:diguanylate cyclase (GGDEF)-like protein/PAS domain S-box-containing protein
MDLALLAVAVRLVTARGNRPMSFLLLIAGVMTMFGADVAYGILVLADGYTAGGWLDVCWPTSHALVTAAGLHPSAPSLMIPLLDRSTPLLTRGRLIGLAASSLLAPLIAAVAPTSAQRGVALLAAAVLFVLVIGRLAGLTGALSRTEARFRSLVEHGADPIMVVEPSGVIRFASPAWARLLGDDHTGDDASTNDTAASGTTLADRLHPDSRPALGPALRALATDSIGSTRPLTGRLRHADGTWRHVEATATNRLDDPAVRGLVLNVRDVTDRAQLEAQLREASLHDPLTRLPNRALLTDRVAQALTTLDRAAHDVAVLFIDLDDFKVINDTLGHAAGDQLLTTIADRLLGCVRPGDTVARLGGDEFAVLLPDLVTRAQADVVADRMRAALADEVSLEGRRVTSAASIGIAFAAPGQSTDAVLRNADLAMYAAKRAGKGHCMIYSPEVLSQAATRLKTAR